MAKAGWVVIPEDLAVQHPLFGLKKGNLRGISILLCIGLARSTLGSFKSWSTGDTLDPSIWDTVSNAAIVVTLLLSLAFLAAWFSRWRGCRTMWLVITIFEVVLAALPIATVMVMVERGSVPGNAAVDAFWPIGLALVIGTGVRLLVWSFMLTSAAYRVTFENRVRADDPILVAPASGVVPGSLPAAVG